MKFSEFTQKLNEHLLLNEAGDRAERQENGFIEAIASAVEVVGGPITLVAGNTTIRDVIGAAKYTGRQASGSEPYTDVQVFVKGKRDPINLSMKGESAPSLAGGGLRGIETVIPGLGSRFFKAAFHHHSKTLQAGDKVPDLFGKLNDKDKLLLVQGNKEIGGPIDYMYIGPMDVRSRLRGRMLNVNGKAIESTSYARDHDLYFRLRARRGDQRFDPEAVDRMGVPKIYGKSPSKGDSAGRLAIIDKVSSRRDVIDF